MCRALPRVLSDSGLPVRGHAAAERAAASLDIPLATQAVGVVNVEVVAEAAPAPIRAEATVLAERDDSVPTQLWPINRRWGIGADAVPILGYTATAVTADKLRCLARRSAPRDVYDLDQLARSPQADLTQAWNMYAASYNDPTREYGRRNHPADIRSTLPRTPRPHRHRLAGAPTTGQSPKTPTSTRPSTGLTASSPTYATPGPTASRQASCTTSDNNTSNNNSNGNSAPDTSRGAATHGAAAGACRCSPPAETGPHPVQLFNGSSGGGVVDSGRGRHDAASAHGA